MRVRVRPSQQPHEQLCGAQQPPPPAALPPYGRGGHGDERAGGPRPSDAFAPIRAQRVGGPVSTHVARVGKRSKSLIRVAHKNTLLQFVHQKLWTFICRSPKFKWGCRFVLRVFENC